MKYPILAITLALSFSQFGTKDKNATTEARPVLSHVDAVMAYEPGRVNIDGQWLGLIQTVRIDGREVPILQNTGARIVVAPEPGDPGFARVDLAGPGGTIHGMMEFLPNVHAFRHGSQLTVRLHGGEPCFYWMQYSFRQLSTPNAVPGVYYHSLLDMTLGSPGSGILATGFAPVGDPVLLRYDVPPTLASPWGGPATSGPLNIQAYCMLGSDLYLCYTNLSSVLLNAPVRP